MLRCSLFSTLRLFRGVEGGGEPWEVKTMMNLKHQIVVVIRNLIVTAGIEVALNRVAPLLLKDWTDLFPSTC